MPTKRVAKNVVESYPNIYIYIHTVYMYIYIFIYKNTTCTNMGPVLIQVRLIHLFGSDSESTAATIEKSHSECFPTSATPGETQVSPRVNEKRRRGSVFEQRKTQKKQTKEKTKTRTVKSSTREKGKR